MITKFFQIISKGKLTILQFHKVPLQRHLLTPLEIDMAEFQRTLLLITQLYRILPLDAALQAVRAGNLPPRAACITFDDGYPDWMAGVIPVLERLKAHATFFITTGQLDGEPMWNERLLFSVSNAPQNTHTLLLENAKLPPLSFNCSLDRINTLTVIERFLKYQSEESRRQFMAQLDAHTSVDSLRAPSMSATDVRELHSRGFDIGAHSVSHPILTHCNPEQAYQEIAGSKEMLESVIRGKVKFFAYPNGIPGRDFNQEHIEMVARAGYLAALTTSSGFASADTRPFQVPRFTPWGPSPRRMKFQLVRNFLMERSELGEEDHQGKRVLMVAFHFPPQAGSSGILRTLNFVKHLPEQGWNNSLIAASPRAFEEQRNDLIASIPPRTRVLRTAALDAARHLSIKGKYPRLFALPDRWSSWWLPAVLRGMAEIKRERPNLIWSTYPIATAHLIGASLSKLSGLPWVADFRDPMVSSGYPADRLQRRMWQWLEARIFQNASACVFTTKSAAETYRQRYPEHASKCHVIENGYDEDVFEQAKPNRQGVPSYKFFLLHSGLIYPQDRNPSTFFAALRTLIDEGTLDAANLCVRFRAPHHVDEVMDCARHHGISECVEVAPPVSYNCAISEMMGADMLLVFQGSNFNTQIPAKIYEYLRAGKPIFAVVDPNGGTAAHLATFNAVHLADIDSTLAIKEAIQRAIKLRGTHAEIEALNNNRVQVKRYSRKAQTKNLRKLFNMLVADVKNDNES
jgi:peptidoglycan/xylan/chitin deacetylase (PgdA/CDA1 family)